MLHSVKQSVLMSMEEFDFIGRKGLKRAEAEQKADSLFQSHSPL
jgi:hypothetical protein